MTLEEAVSIVKPHVDKIRAEGNLDLAWERINALGGHAGEYDDFGKGINYAVEQALSIIEELGGSDPLPKRAAARR
jgi:hypothetical protein